MVRKKGKILIIIILVVMIFNFMSPISLADGFIDIAKPDETENGEYTPTGEGGTTLSTILDWGAGSLLYPLRMLIYGFASVINLIVSGIAGSGTDVNVETILFNQVDLTKIDFFNMSGSGQAFVQSLRENVATWYYTMRNIAIVASLCVLIYIAIRMATSTIASDKAEYKRMFTDWCVGFVLIFVLHYIMLLTISANNLLVNIFYTTLGNDASNNVSVLTTYTTAIGDKATKVIAAFTESFGAVIIYLILLCINLAFLIMYIKRLIVIAFLMIIAPLITVTYSIDRVKDGESQSLNVWLKEFIWTILIQPFHCLIYLVFVTISFSALQEQTLASSLLAIMCMLFIMQAEDIVKKIFGIQADNVGKMSGAMALAAGGLLAARRVTGQTAGAAVSKTSKTAGNVLRNMPQIPGGAAIGNAVGEATTFAQKVSNVVDSPKVRKGLEMFDNVVNNTVAGKATKKVISAAASYGKWSAKKASRIIGGTIAGTTAQGDIAKMIIGYQAGGMVGDALGEKVKNATQAGMNKLNNLVETGRTRNATNNLNASYEELKKDRKFTDDNMKERAEIYLKLNMDDGGNGMFSKLRDSEKRFVMALQTMQHQLQKAGEDTSIDNILNKIKMKDNQNNSEKEENI